MTVVLADDYRTSTPSYSQPLVVTIRSTCTLVCVILVRVACGSRIALGPYEKAQASEEKCKRAAHPQQIKSDKLLCWTCLCVCMPACKYVYVYTC